MASSSDATASDASATGAWREGVRRVNAAPALLAGLVLLTLLVAMPLAAVLDGMIAGHLGSSPAAARAADAGDAAWFEDFADTAAGVGRTFRPTVVGGAAPLGNLSSFLDGEALTLPMGGAVVAWVLLWAFLSGGVIARYAGDRHARGAAGFFSACGRQAARLLRLGVIGLAGYLLLFATLHPLLFDRIYPALIYDVTAERTAVAARIACYALFGGALILLNLVVDYARISIVVEDRRSALAALAAAARFVRRQPGSWRLYGWNGLLFVSLVVAYALASRWLPASGAQLWLLIAAGQLCLVARQYLKLLFCASETAYFQRALACAPDTAMAAVEWPDAPVAQAIVNTDTVVR